MGLLPVEVKRAGVEASLRDLASQLEEVSDLAGHLYPPTLTSYDYEQGLVVNEFSQGNQRT